MQSGGILGEVWRGAALEGGGRGEVCGGSNSNNSRPRRDFMSPQHFR